MVGKHAQCVVLLMVSWLGQCALSSKVLQVAVLQHPASPRTCADSHHSSVIRGSGDSRDLRDHGHCGLGQIAVIIATRKGGRQGLFFSPLPDSSGMKGGFELLSAGWSCPSKMFHGNKCCSSPLVKGSQPHTGHGMTMFCSLYGAIEMFTRVVSSPHKWFYLYGRCPAAYLNCSCLSLQVPDGQAVQNDFL